MCRCPLGGEPPQARDGPAAKGSGAGRGRPQVVPRLRADQARRRLPANDQRQRPAQLLQTVPCGPRQRVQARLYGGNREYHLRRRYGVGEKEFQELLAEQGGVCAICRRPDPEHLDHDHRTGWVRGILCFNCNGGLGQFKDNADVLARAITYLRGTTWQRVLIHPGVFQMCSPTRGRPPSQRS
ncbi:endonuclease VII domain-containing protein [Micromonospora sp. NPDC005686]|uniref:endonuclease VII domain-containing protein n=1 Tax=unclassified Micromonospora TaxID=2617518 RepID=UPI0033A2509D